MAHIQLYGDAGDGLYTAIDMQQVVSSYRATTSGLPHLHRASLGSAMASETPIHEIGSLEIRVLHPAHAEPPGHLACAILLICEQVRGILQRAKAEQGDQDLQQRDDPCAHTGIAHWPGRQVCTPPWAIYAQPALVCWLTCLHSIS